MNELFLAVVLTWSVIDGDTIRMEGTVWPNIKVVEHVRLLGVDTPELRAPSTCERAMAQSAKVYTESKMAMAKVRTVTASATRDSFGRVLGNVMLDGVSLADELMKQPFARAYGVKGAWC